MLQRIVIRAASTQQLPFILRATTVNRIGAVRHSSTLPSVTDASFWKSLVPKPFRKENRRGLKNKKSKEWNPATFYIVMFLFIGSMSIQMIALRNSTERYTRQSAVRLGLLKEIVEKIQNGEDVDVEKLLGTGDPQKEMDWEEMLKQIEREESNDKASTPSEPTPKKESKPVPVSKPLEQQPDSPPPKPKPANFGNFF